MIQRNPQFAHSQQKRRLPALFLHSWWVILFALICSMAYEQSRIKQQKEQAFLQARRAALFEEKQALLEEKRRLETQIASQSDPASIELMLMRGLGLVPEGQIKVLLSKE